MKDDNVVMEVESLKLEKPVLDGENLVISGNFDTVKGQIQAVVDRYKDVKLTEMNVAYVKTLKSQFVSLRTSIDREKKEYKQCYITPASKFLDTYCDELKQVIAEGENALDKQLKEYDQRRIDELNIILQDYVDEFSEKYALRPEYKEKIMLKAKYYNKTQAEEDTIADIEEQCKAFKETQDTYDTSVELIKAECEDTSFVPLTYIRELAYKNISDILFEIKADKKERQILQAKIKGGDKVVIGEKIDRELEKAMTFDVENETRERIMRIVYKKEQAKLIAKFFEDNDIHFEFISTEI